MRRSGAHTASPASWGPRPARAPGQGESGFPSLSPTGRGLTVTVLALLLAATGLVMWPSAFDAVTLRGRTGPHLHEFATRVLYMALAPIGLALAIDPSIAGEIIAGRTAGRVLGASGAACAARLWCGWPLAAIHRGRGHAPGPGARNAGEPLEQRIRHVLTETRTVLPGAQALLGFGTVAVLMHGFGEFSPLMRTVHLVSLTLIALTTAILMTPAAYHRMIGGEKSERFYRVASRLLLLGMAALAPGLGGKLLSRDGARHRLARPGTFLGARPLLFCCTPSGSGGHCGRPDATTDLAGARKRVFMRPSPRSQGGARK